MPSKPESQQKKRKSNQPPATGVAQEALEARVTGAVARHPGVRLEIDFAGMWNELGFRLDVPDEMPPRAWVDLANEIREAILDQTARLPADCGWSLGLYQKDECILPLSQGDSRQLLCPVCGHVQPDWLGEICISCRSPGLT